MFKGEVFQDANWWKGLRQIWEHGERIQESPISAGAPSVVELETEETVLRIPVKGNLTGKQLMELVKGIEMPVKLVSGE